jgi:hypothetical protein
MFCGMLPNSLEHGTQVYQRLFRDRVCRLGSVSIDLLLQIEPRRQVVNIVTGNLKGVNKWPIV